MPPSSTRKSCADHDSRMAARSCCLIMGSSARPLRSGTWLSGPTCPPAEHRCIWRISTRGWCICSLSNPGARVATRKDSPPWSKPLAPPLIRPSHLLPSRRCSRASTSTRLRRRRGQLSDIASTSPVGHDIGPNGEPSPLMRNYRIGGTPWVVLIDTNRTVRFNGFSLPPTHAKKALDALTSVS